MEIGNLKGIPEGPLPMQSNHVIWGSIRSSAEDTSSRDVPSRHDLSGLALENVVYKDWSTSNENSTSHDPDSSHGATAGERLPDAWKNKDASEQEFLLKHGVWSVGSQGHADGLCKPCHYVGTAKGCKFGFNCNFCHLPHMNCSTCSGNRPSKDKRAKAWAIADTLRRLDESSGLRKEVSSQSMYMQRLLRRDDSSQPEQDQAPAVKEAEDPVHGPVPRRTVRVKTAQNLMIAIGSAQTAKPAAADAAATVEDRAARPVNAEKRRQSNLVSL